MSLLESAELGAKITKEEFAAVEAQLRLDLINAQFDLGKAPFAVAVLFAGDDPVATEEIVYRLHEWLDPRHVETNYFEAPSAAEKQFPAHRRFWLAIPGHGRIGLMLGAWAARPIALRLRNKIGRAQFTRFIEHVQRYERELVDDGTLLLKFWFHMPRKKLAKRMARAKADPSREFRIDTDDWQVYQRYDRAIAISEEYLASTNTPSAPWQIVESTDRRHRDLTVGRALLAALRGRLDAAAQEAAAATAAPQPVAAASVTTAAIAETSLSPLETLDMSAKLADAEYAERLPELQATLRKLTDRAARRGVQSIFAFEGWDAAGKGGAIRRVIQAIHPRNYRVVSIAAPTAEERAHHWLWRFWTRLPQRGRVAIFDRTWYGRVLVERVEGFATPAQWRRGYDEIVDFERLLTEHGMVLHKFWMHVSEAEQLRRFEERQQTGFKAYKITEEDWRNRSERPAYLAAIEDMLLLTDKPEAPWTAVAGDDKNHARITILETIVHRLRDSL